MGVDEVKHMDEMNDYTPEQCVDFVEHIQAHLRHGDKGLNIEKLKEKPLEVGCAICGKTINEIYVQNQLWLVEQMRAKVPKYVLVDEEGKVIPADTVSKKQVALALRRAHRYLVEEKVHLPEECPVCRAASELNLWISQVTHD